MWEKTRREEEKASRKQEKRTAKEKEREKPTIALVPCKLDPPFWWKEETEDKIQVIPKEISIEPSKTVYQTSYLRWQDKPKLFEKSLTDPCLRREEVAK